MKIGQIRNEGFAEKKFANIHQEKGNVKRKF